MRNASVRVSPAAREREPVAAGTQALPAAVRVSVSRRGPAADAAEAHGAERA